MSVQFRYTMLLLSTCTALNAAVCPSAEWVHASRFVIAIQNPHDDSQWNFQSDWRDHKGEMWRVEYGSFFPEVISTSQALTTGQLSFLQSPPTVPYPEAVEIPGYYLCEYTGNGEKYWISAVAKL